MPDEPLTREQAKEEMGRSMTDPTHFQHQAYTQNLPGYSAWVDALYNRIPAEKGADGKDQVQIDEGGITIGGEPPEAQETKQQYAEVKANLVQHFGAETESRMLAAKSFVESFEPAERELILTLADRLQDDSLAIRAIDAIARKIAKGATR